MTQTRILRASAAHFALAMLLAMLALLLFAVPSEAKHRPTVGVGDNGPSMFLDPNFQSLNTKISRKIIPWDFHKSGFESAQLASWVANARALGIEPLLAIERSRTQLRRLPSAGQYRYSIRQLRKLYPDVRTISPWNEANHVSQPTYRNPKRAAQYYKIVRKYCKGCRIVAADVLDQRNMIPWIKKFKRYAGKSPRIWGLHSYADGNRRVSWNRSATRKLLRSVRGKVWLTEVGGITGFKRSFRYNERRAATAVKRTLQLATKSRRIQRVYLYSWYGTDHASLRGSLAWDSGLVGANGQPRPGFHTLKTWLKKNGRR